MREQLLAITDAYCAATGMSRSRLSTKALGAGHRLDSIADGGDLRTGTCETAIQWLSDNWPAGTDWPTDVDRPAPKVEAGA